MGMGRKAAGGEHVPLVLRKGNVADRKITDPAGQVQRLAAG
jgi:hypothetical protein